MIFNLSLILGACQESDIKEHSPSISELIQRAGNSMNEVDRYNWLVEAKAASADSPDGVDAFNVLLPTVERWAFSESFWVPGDQSALGEDGFLGGDFISRVLPGQIEDSLYPPTVDQDSELYPIWLMYRGRMLIWSAIQNGLMVELFFEEGRQNLQDAFDAFPENDLIGMYLNKPIPWDLNPLPDGPDWAIYQADALRRLTQIIDFWIDTRQRPDGQFGGGWGDDVEMWRWWIPTLIGLANPKHMDSWRLLSENIHSLPRLENGYSSTIADVEHSAEDTADTLTPMLLIGESQEWVNKSLTLLDLMTTTWTAENDRGRLQFVSSHLGAEGHSESLDLACDTATHVRVMQPVFALWQKGYAAPQHILSSWMSSWVENAQDSDNGKPVGILSSSMRFPSGESGGTSNEWWNPVCHYSEKTFQYPRGMSLLTRALVQTEWLTGDSMYFEPLAHLAGLRRSQLNGELDVGEDGSESWAVYEVRGALSDALGKRRVVNGDVQYDDILMQDGSAYLRYLLTGDISILETVLSHTVAALSVNFQAYADDVRFTDRIMKFHSKYANQYGEPVYRPDTKLLYSMLTGDPGDPTVMGLAGAKWNFDGVSALVDTNRTDSFSAKLYAWKDGSAQVAVDLLRLEPANYDAELQCGESTEQIPFTYSQALSFELPSRVSCELTVSISD